MKNRPTIAIVADWLVTFAGAEKVIAELIELYPDADIFSVVDFLSNEDRDKFKGKVATTTFIQNLPLSKKKYQNYLPLMPLAIEQLDVSKYDIVISSSHAVAKGVITGPDQIHFSYVHSPIRYAWDMQHQYLKSAGLDKGFKGYLVKYLLHKIRLWDIRSSNGVDNFISNSEFISRRIKKVYGRESEVIYPPVDIERFELLEEKEDFYLTASRLVPYKRVDLIVDAFKTMPDKKLIVIGDGSEMDKIKNKITPNIHILGYQSNDVMQEYMRKAKAFVFAAEEDFGIIPVEAMACGTPVIAYGKGGALETVVPLGFENPTGCFFHEQSITSLIEAIERFENSSDSFIPINCRLRAEKFSTARFKSEIKSFIDTKWEAFNNNRSFR